MRSLRRRSELVQTHLLCTAAIMSFHVGGRCQGYGGETVVTDSLLGDRWQGYGGETVVMATATKKEYNLWPHDNLEISRDSLKLACTIRMI